MKKYISSFVLASLVFASSLMADEESEVPFTLKYDLEIKCPASDELEAFREVMPKNWTHSDNYQKWSEATLSQLEALISLIKSGNINHGSCNISINETKPPSPRYSVESEEME